jgi:hypothetical protein
MENHSYIFAVSEVLGGIGIGVVVVFLEWRLLFPSGEIRYVNPGRPRERCLKERVTLRQWKRV